MKARERIVYIVCAALSATFLDIIVVETWFRPSQSWELIWIWHIQFQALMLILPLVLTVLARSIIYLSLYPYFLFGLEDTVFYIVGHRTIPKVYVGVTILGFPEPSRALILLINAIGLLLIALVILLAPKIESSNLWMKIRHFQLAKPEPLKAWKQKARAPTPAVAFTLIMLLLAIYASSKPASISAPPEAWETVPSQTHSTSTATQTVSKWKDWARTAWAYYQPGVGLNSKTLLHYAVSEWNFFTDWDLATYILALIDADRLQLIESGPSFQERATAIINFLESRQLTEDKIAYWAYDANNGLPEASARPSNAADAGRLLIALHTLKQYRTDLTSRIDNIVYSKHNFTKLADDKTAGWGSGFYAYYIAQGFKLFGFEDYPAVQNSLKALDELEQKTQVTIYGEQLPLTWITAEPIIHNILDLETNATYRELATKVLNTYEQRYLATGRLTAFSEGVYDSQGYVFEWVVRGDTGETWTVTQIVDGKVETLNVSPAIYLKIAFALHAVFPSNYTSTLLKALLAKKLATSKGFLEGVTEDGEIIPVLTDKTNGMILNAARYTLEHSPDQEPRTVSKPIPSLPDLDYSAPDSFTTLIRRTGNSLSLRKS